MGHWGPSEVRLDLVLKGSDANTLEATCSSVGGAPEGGTLACNLASAQGLVLQVSVNQLPAPGDSSLLGLSSALGIQEDFFSCVSV